MEKGSVAVDTGEDVLGIGCTFYRQDQAYICDIDSWYSVEAAREWGDGK